MRSLKEIKERSDTAYLMIAKFGAEGEKTVCYQSMEDIPSLITTIESQKEEIERLQKPALSLAYRVLKKKYEEDAESYIEHIFKIESEIESLKAITELAVKGLERISVTFERGEMVRLAYDHLDKIKELQNGTTS